MLPPSRRNLNAPCPPSWRLPTPVTGAGRTDTGVHGPRLYGPHFDAAPVAEAEALRYHLNAMLPDDIAVHRIRRVRDDAHARFDAAEREYTYYMRSEKDPFSRETSWQYRGALDTAAMNEAAAHLLAFDDFTTFAKLNSANKTNICKVTYARWRQEGTELIFTIRANRFLRNMVRAITGTLVGVGRGKNDAGRIPQHHRRPRPFAGGLPPPRHRDFS